MKDKFLLSCTTCRTFVSNPLHHVCGTCGTALQPHYLAKPSFQGRTMARFGDLLPMRASAFESFLDAVPRTPLWAHKYDGANLFLKDETLLPSGSTKDRMAVAALGHMLQNGVREFVLSSTGNSSSSFIYWTNKLGGAMRCHVFAAKAAIHRIRFENQYGVVHAIDGDFVEAGKAAKVFAEREALHWEGGFFNFARREGLKTSYLEAFEQMDYDVDVVIQTVSSGMGIIGGYKGLQELHRFGMMNKRPAFVCVQQDTCMPMVRAYEMGLDRMKPELVVKNPRGLAEAVLRGDPTGSYPYVRRMVSETRGLLMAVSQASLVRARQELLKRGVNGCYASAASFAAAQHLRDTGFIASGDRVLVMITGAQHNISEMRAAA